MLNNPSLTPPTGQWIAIDGSDGVGKTSLARALCERIPQCILVPEFSDSSSGRLLQEAVTKNAHVISSSLLQQSLLFLADFFYLYDTVIAPNVTAGRVVISDRGLLSKYVYQYTILIHAYPPPQIVACLDTLAALVPTPHMTVLLTCEEFVQFQRLLHRDGQCDAARVQFIQEVAITFQRYLAEHPTMTTITIHQTQAMTQADVEQTALTLLRPRFFAIE